MKAKRQFYNLIFSVFEKVFSVLYLRVKICFHLFFTFVETIVFAFAREIPFSVTDII